ncbi:beta/gamma crystallin domain-containing protein 2 [Tachyglossus aculeatus]|uniref:beta/gamma crystallin domain-containing protein 2 n=1 Tax=Tachyglossus aculeatus TaxID=9261 RepID=UPI0018F5F998|nr:beta/gamma crystallin domain-containing protein 2 [Tachyglossus aculeatus]
MEEVAEAAGPTAPVDRRVASATLTWRQKPPGPGREEVRHRLHKVSLVSSGADGRPGPGTEADVRSSSVYEYSRHREVVNGVTTKDEESESYRGPRGEEPQGALAQDSSPDPRRRFLSHGPIFSKMFTPPPKGKKPTGRPEKGGDSRVPAESTPGHDLPGPEIGSQEEPPGPGTWGAGHGIPRALNSAIGCQAERRVTRTVRTTTIAGGQMESHVSTTVTSSPVLPGGLPRGRHVSRTIRTLTMVNPQPGAPAARPSSPSRLPGSPSRSQALEIISTLVPGAPADPGPAKSGDPTRPRGTRPSRLPRAVACPTEGGSRLLSSRGAAGHPEGTDGVVPVIVVLTPPEALGVIGREEGGSQVEAAGEPGAGRTDVGAELEACSPKEANAMPIGVSDRDQPREACQSAAKLGSPPLGSATRRRGQTPREDGPRETEAQTSPGGEGGPCPTDPEDLEPPCSPETSPRSPTPTDHPPKASPPIPDTCSTAANSSPPSSAGSPESSPPPHTDHPQGVSPPSPTAQTQEVSPPAPTAAPQEGSPPPGTVHPREMSPLPPAAGPQERSPPSPTAHHPGENEVPDPGSGSTAERLPGPSDPLAMAPTESAAVIPAGPPVTGSQGEAVTADDEAALTADLELFVDTLRSMETPDILRTHKLPRAPRSSYLAVYATLPAIEEDQAGPQAFSPRASVAPVEEPEELEELENPYLSDDEKLQRRQKAQEAQQSFVWENLPRRPAQENPSPLEMMKRHAAAAAAADRTGEPGGPARPGALKASELLAERLEKRISIPSRLGSSILFGSVQALREGGPGSETSPASTTPETLGTKLSALQPHKVPALKKSPGQMPLLSDGKESRKSVPPPAKACSYKKKERGKLNTRPGKIVLFSEPGFQGTRREIWGDVADATAWPLCQAISIRVVRGGWVLYEEPQFRGRKLALAEGDVELTEPWGPQSPASIGSLRRVVTDYSIPEISLFTEEAGGGTQVTLTGPSDDPQGQGPLLPGASIIVSAGLWLLYSKPSFAGHPHVLEPGNYPNLEAWGGSEPHVGSLQPVRLGCPTVEKPGEPKAVVFEGPNFEGPSWTVSRDIYHLQKPEDEQSPRVATAGSLRILGGCWVGYEKEGFRGHQYLLEEGDYPDWTSWGGFDEALTSLRLIRTDVADPAVVLFKAMDFEDGPSVELSEALSDVELANYGPVTQSIHVLSGVWVAYEHVDFSGEQFVLEKGVYRNCDDWGSGSGTINSLQPILQVGEHSRHFLSKIQLFSGPDFLGEQVTFKDDQPALPTAFQPQSCRVQGGSWILFDETEFEGNQHVLSEGEYPTLTAMGYFASAMPRSLRKVPVHFSEPSIFLHGLECFEGKEIELNHEVRSLQAEGFNNHVLSVRVKGGVWVLYEHSDFRGRQWVLDCTEITNWLTYSGTQKIGSLYPIKQRRVYFRLRNEEMGGFLSVPEDVEDMKAGRVVVSKLQDKSSFIWYYEEGLLKNQAAPTMSLQVIGPPSQGSKVVLWAESRLPRQTWAIEADGHISSQMFQDKILDVKGGRTYDRDHAVLWDASDERPSQIWGVQVL